MAAPSVTSTKETTNYARLCRLLVGVGSQALRDTFDRCYTGKLHTFLGNSSVHSTLKRLKGKRILNPTQWSKLYPAVPSTVTSASFDITLVSVLLREICGLSPPASTRLWDKPPPATDTCREADLVRIKHFRNNVYGHAEKASVDDVTFNRLWHDIESVLVRLGGSSYAAAIAKLKGECMDPDIEEHYKEALLMWKKDEDNIKNMIEELDKKWEAYMKSSGKSFLNFNDWITHRFWES